jgi:hypothetical protein
MQFEPTGSLDEALEGLKPQSVNRLRGVWIDGTADEFCHKLEANLDRPVVNETNLQGEFRFRAGSPEGMANDFSDRLRDQLGLVITPAKRDVEALIFETR